MWIQRLTWAWATQWTPSGPPHPAPLLHPTLSHPSKHPVQTISLVGRGRARGGGQVSVEGGKSSYPLPPHFPTPSLENHRKTRYIHDFTHVLPRFPSFYLIQNIETHPTCEGARPPPTNRVDGCPHVDLLSTQHALQLWVGQPWKTWKIFQARKSSENPTSTERLGIGLGKFSTLYTEVLL